MLDRRAFIELAALTAVSHIPSPVRSMMKRRVVVLGGGIAGAAAAQALSEAGHAVEVLALGDELQCEWSAYSADDAVSRTLYADPAINAILQRICSWRERGFSRPVHEFVQWRSGFEPMSVSRSGPGVTLRSTEGVQLYADAAVVAMARDGLRRIHWSKGDQDAAVSGHFQGKMRDQVVVLAHFREGADQLFRFVGDEARWLESLPHDHQLLQVRHRIAALRCVSTAMVDISATESLRRRKWPADLGWEPPTGRDRASCVPALDMTPTALAFCGSTHSVADGLLGLLESAVRCAVRVAAHLDSTRIRGQLSAGSSGGHDRDWLGEVSRPLG